MGRTAAAVAKEPFHAEHEAAYAVTLDDAKWRVLDVNLDKRQTRAETKDYIDSLDDLDLDDPAEQERVLSLAVSAVAGYVAERAIGSEEPLISEILAADEMRLFRPVLPCGCDTNKTVHFLQRLERNTVEDVIAVEKLAEGILTRRKPHLKALAGILIKKRVVDGEDLEIALGKKPPKEGTPGRPSVPSPPPPPDKWLSVTFRPWARPPALG